MGNTNLKTEQYVKHTGEKVSGFQHKKTVDTMATGIWTRHKEYTKMNLDLVGGLTHDIP